MTEAERGSISLGCTEVLQYRSDHVFEYLQNKVGSETIVFHGVQQCEMKQRQGFCMKDKHINKILPEIAM